MALEDLLQSLENAAGTLDRLGTYPEHATGLRDNKRQIEQARAEKNEGRVRQLIATDVANHFLYGMGSFWDLVICEGNDNVPEDMTASEANHMLETAKEDLVFSLLFWDTELRTALCRKKKVWGRLAARDRKRYAKEMRKFEKMRKKGTPVPLPVPPMPLNIAFHSDPDWFESWTDWGKLVSDESVRPLLTWMKSSQ